MRSSNIFIPLEGPKPIAQRPLPSVTALTPAVQAVSVASGAIADGKGGAVTVRAAELSFGDPEIQRVEARALDQGGVNIPRNYERSFEDWDPWQAGPTGDPSLIVLTPRRNRDGTLILGHLYRHWRSETLEVRRGDRQFVRDHDYVFNEDWGLVANREVRLGTPGERSPDLRASVEIALPRLDLVQCGPDGVPKVKRGESAIVCPQLPAPDPEHTALAGIFIAPWRAGLSPTQDGRASPAGTEYAVREENVFPLRRCAEPKPLGAAALLGSVARLRVGSDLRIAFLGDSITLGAEAPRWCDITAYSEGDQTWRGLTVHRLCKCFPQATVEPIEVYKGGEPVSWAVDRFSTDVVPMRPHLVVIAFGANDVNGPIGCDPVTPLWEYERQMRGLIERCQRQLGAEVLLVSCFPLNPWLRNGAVARLKEYNATIRSLAVEYKIGYAPVYEAFQQLPMKGMPPYSRLHNWINHPDAVGHAIYADAVLGLFARANESL